MNRSLSEDLAGLAASLAEFQVIATETEARRARVHQLITMELPEALELFAARAAMLEGLPRDNVVDLSGIFARERRDHLRVVEGGEARR